MKKFLTIASLCLLQILILAPQIVVAEDKTPSEFVDVYKNLEEQLQKFTTVTVGEMQIEVNLTNQIILIHKGDASLQTNIVCAFPCSTGPGKYAMVPETRKTTIYETGKLKGGDRKDTMRHFVRIVISNTDGSEAVVGFHSSNGKYVPRIPTTHGCIRLPEDAALALFLKVKGQNLGEVSRKVPVLFTGQTPKLF